MLRLDKITKTWKHAATLSDQLNLYGFWNETAFLTKSGDLGMVLRFRGVDYESLDHAKQEYTVKRLEAALKSFDSGFSTLFSTSKGAEGKPKKGADRSSTLVSTLKGVS
jgi:type IV secretion system protein TrbE